MDGIDPIALATVNSLGKFIPKDTDEKTALKAFEAYFLGEMLRRTAPKDETGLFDGGSAGRMYQDHLYQEIARIVAEQGDFGLAKSLEGHLDKKAAGETGHESNVLDGSKEKLPNGFKAESKEEM